MTKPTIYIGIDTGVSTGVAIWNSKTKAFVLIETMPIHKAMDAVFQWVITWNNKTDGKNIKVRVEDARQRTGLKFIGKERLQGAGSIKRDAKIWEDFLTDIGCEFDMVAPHNNRTKVKDKPFKDMTGWEGRTSEHSRDAAMLVYNF